MYLGIVIYICSIRRCSYRLIKCSDKARGRGSHWTSSKSPFPSPGPWRNISFTQGTAYTPIKLTPGKLRNPFEARVQEAQTTSTRSGSTGGPKKLTWSERQALAKKQADEEGQRSKAVSFNPQTSTVSPVRFGARSGAAVGTAASVVATEPEPEVAAMFPVSINASNLFLFH